MMTDAARVQPGSTGAVVDADAVLECIGAEQSKAHTLHIARPGSMIGCVGVPHYDQFAGQALFFTQVDMIGSPAPVRRFLLA